MTLDDTIAKAVKTDRLNGLTLYRTFTGWQASARFEGSAGWRVMMAKTPEEAVFLVLATAEPVVEAASDLSLFD